MTTILLMLAVFGGYLIAYHTYGRFLAAKIFKLNSSAPVPSRTQQDGIDFVPAKKGIIFGHHFTSIAGTGPIVGPAIGVIWGWVPALIWVFAGSIFMGAVQDFGALVISLRNRGTSISEITAEYISPRVRFIFFLIIFFALLIVIAIFGLVIAIIFNMYPQSVFPVWMEIPIALALGFGVYKKKFNVVLLTAAAVTVMYITVAFGHVLPFAMSPVFGMPATGIWTIILLIYAFIASTLPVTMLLQPRDYINAWQLFIAMGLLVLAIIVSGAGGHLAIAAPAFNPNPQGAPPIMPFLFITIACGAISGFHSLVSSGTSSKQIATETDARFVGYGSMLMEAALATLVIIAVTAGIGIAYKLSDGTVLTGSAAWNAHYGSWGAADGLKSNISAFVTGSANMIGFLGIPRPIAIVVMGVFAASFAGTTLDTSTRIQRYVISEIFSHTGIKCMTGRYAATLCAVVTALLLAFASGTSGAGAMKLWPMFGAVNQLLAALALLVISVYLKKEGGMKFLVSFIPCVLMLVMTVWSLVLNQITWITKGNAVLAALNGIIMLLAVWMTGESLYALALKDRKG